MIECTCGSGGHPRHCKLHPDQFRIHVAEMGVESHFTEGDEKEAYASMDEFKAAIQAAEDRKDREIASLKKLVFEAIPTKNKGLRDLFKGESAAGGFGGAPSYEVWLRTLDYREVSRLIRLHTSVIDSLRLRRRFVQHEEERRALHSQYGTYPDFLSELRP